MATFRNPGEGVPEALTKMGFKEWVIEYNGDDEPNIITPELTDEQRTEMDAIRHRDVPWARVRARRDNMLKDLDWTQGMDVPTAIREKWATYRQALRDLPASGSDPDALTWPTSPDAPAPVVEEEVVEISSESAASASATPIESSATPE